MSVTIKRHGQGFKLRFSEPGTDMRSYSVIADDINEVMNSVGHYYGGDHTCGDIPETCPSCRLAKREQLKRKRRKP